MHFHEGYSNSLSKHFIKSSAPKKKCCSFFLHSSLNWQWWISNSTSQTPLKNPNLFTRRKKIWFKTNAKKTLNQELWLSFIHLYIRTKRHKTFQHFNTDNLFAFPSLIFPRVFIILATRMEYPYKNYDIIFFSLESTMHFPSSLNSHKNIVSLWNGFNYSITWRGPIETTTTMWTKKTATKFSKPKNRKENKYFYIGIWFKTKIPCVFRHVRQYISVHHTLRLYDVNICLLAVVCLFFLSLQKKIFLLTAGVLFRMISTQNTLGSNNTQSSSHRAVHLTFNAILEIYCHKNFDYIHNKNHRAQCRKSAMDIS